MVRVKNLVTIAVFIGICMLMAVSSAEEMTAGHLYVGPSAHADYANLQEAIDAVPDGGMLIVEPGTYEAVPSYVTDPQCGNCQEPDTVVAASTGFVISGKSLTIQGLGDVELVTNAGYGVYIEDCPDVKLIGLKITGGVRDQDGSATCAGVVVRRSTVEITGCEIYGNEGDYSVTVAGIGGVMGREGAILHIHHNKIHDNSWDGVALYRGAQATIHDNEIWNGRGASVGITWDSSATVIRNDIHDYWKGIGSFGNTRVGVYNNYVHDIHGWGIIATGTSDMICRNNTVVRCGNVGIAGWSETASIEITNNIIAGNGTVDQWVAPRVGIWMNCDPKNFDISHNVVWDNFDTGVAFGYEEFDDGTWGYSYDRDYNGSSGNIYADPMLSDDSYVVGDSSPCIDAGAEELLDPDGSVSDIGATGGAYAL